MKRASRAIALSLLLAACGAPPKAAEKTPAQLVEQAMQAPNSRILAGLLAKIPPGTPGRAEAEDRLSHLSAREKAKAEAAATARAEAARLAASRPKPTPTPHPVDRLTKRVGDSPAGPLFLGYKIEDRSAYMQVNPQVWSVLSRSDRRQIMDMLARQPEWAQAGLINAWFFVGASQLGRVANGTFKPGPAWADQ